MILKEFNIPSDRDTLYYCVVNRSNPITRLFRESYPRHWFSTFLGPVEVTYIRGDMVHSKEISLYANYLEDEYLNKNHYVIYMGDTENDRARVIEAMFMEQVKYLKTLKNGDRNDS